MKNYKRKPDYIPSEPKRIYKKEWISWNDFLNIKEELNSFVLGKEIQIFK